MSDLLELVFEFVVLNIVSNTQRKRVGVLTLGNLEEGLLLLNGLLDESLQLGAQKLLLYHLNNY
jgi:hypothetical protein